MQAKIWMGFFSYALRRYWWLIMAFTFAGAAWGYFTALGTPNSYEVRASFVVPSEDAWVEYERMISRSLVTKAINAESRFEISNYIDKGTRNQFNMYNGSPFSIRVLSFPAYLRDHEHHIRLFKDHSYELSIHTPETTLVEKGMSGVAIAIGSVKLLVDATQFWDDKATTGNFSFVVQSEEALASRFLDNLYVLHSAEHPYRISLHYTDAHPDLALDLLNAFTQAYLEDCKFRQDEFLLARKMEVEGQLRVLETQIISSNDVAFWKTLQEQSLIVQDSSIVEMLRLRKETQALEQRLRLWDEYRRGGLTEAGLLEKLRKVDLGASDSTLLGLLAINKKEGGTQAEESLLRISQQVDTLERADLEKMAAMDSRTLETNANFLATSNPKDGLRKDLIIGDGSKTNANVILFERYLSAMAEAAKIELETRQSFVGPQLIDPPYHMPGHGRGFKIRRMLANVLGMTLLGIFVALIVSLRGRRIGSLPYFQAASGTETVMTWSLADNALVQRKQATQLELSLTPEDKIIALVGSTPEVDRLADSMAAGAFNLGKKVLVLNSILGDDQVGWDRLTLPQSTQPGWWFSAAASAFLKEKSAIYDRILLCLPHPDQSPEMLAALKLTQKTYFIVQKNSTRITEWRSWQRHIQELDISAWPIFVLSP